MFSATQTKRASLTPQNSRICLDTVLKRKPEHGLRSTRPAIWCLLKNAESMVRACCLPRDERFSTSGVRFVWAAGVLYFSVRCTLPLLCPGLGWDLDRMSVLRPRFPHAFLGEPPHAGKFCCLPACLGRAYLGWGVKQINRAKNGVNKAWSYWSGLTGCLRVFAGMQTTLQNRGHLPL